MLHGKELRKRMTDQRQVGGERQFDGACHNCGKTGHRNRDCWSERSKGKAKVKRRTEDHTTRASMDTKVDNTPPLQQRHKGVCKFVNVCDSQSYAPRPHRLYQNPDGGN